MIAKTKKVSRPVTPIDECFYDETAPDTVVAAPSDDEKVMEVRAVHRPLLASAPSMFEQKMYDLYSPPGALGGGQIVCVNQIGQGTGFDSRTGRELIPAELLMTWTISPTVPGSEYVRIMVVLDRYSNGAVPSLAVVLDLGFITDRYFAYVNQGSYGNRFKVLYDWHSDQLTINGATAPTLGHKSNVLSARIKLPKTRTRYVDGSASLPPVNNAVFVIAVPMGSSAQAVYGFSSRYLFTDP